MYTYYYLMAINAKPKWLKYVLLPPVPCIAPTDARPPNTPFPHPPPPAQNSPMYITVMQIAQMVVGVTVSLAGYFYNQKDPIGCEVHPYVIKVSAVIYASYLYLFCEFMVKRFFLKTTHAASGGKKVGGCA